MSHSFLALFYTPVILLARNSAHLAWFECEKGVREAHGNAWKYACFGNICGGYPKSLWNLASFVLSGKEQMFPDS